MKERFSRPSAKVGWRGQLLMFLPRNRRSDPSFWACRTFSQHRILGGAPTRATRRWGGQRPSDLMKTSFLMCERP